jgi:hypothetical protein
MYSKERRLTNCQVMFETYLAIEYGTDFAKAMNCYKSVEFLINNEELHNVYTSLNTVVVIKRRRMCRVCSIHGRDEKCILNFGQKTSREETIWKT